MSTNTYDVGDLVRCSGIFKNSSRVNIDPSAVFVEIKTPAEVITTYTYGVDAALVKLATGSYYIDVSATTAGTWHYRWYSTGSGQAAMEAYFVVAASAF